VFRKYQYDTIGKNREDFEVYHLWNTYAMNISKDKRTMTSASTTPLGLSRTNISAIFLEVIARIFTATIEYTSPGDGNIDAVGGSRCSASLFLSTMQVQQQFSDDCKEDNTDIDDDEEEDRESATNDEIESLVFKYLSNLSKSDRITFHSSPSTLSNDL
jgi:hypothetical protein